MLGELMMFVATEAVVFVATALVFSGPDPVEDEEQIAREERADEAWGRTAPARSLRLDGVSRSF
ncbi:hypothetical protein [Inquilinus limosus]|uniref:Uncharacterized protein n=1 Tax=Inquilinus limosus TaxID=171674 RepID=A0A211ZRL3_9PROT|nr:hypothetical protein [Inquilinus limosus]OWJ67913.1 hypothetical protein BWR60_06795 [Inquilinus limosus]